jgi:hypothetical protein
VTMVVAVIVDGGLTTMAMKVPHPLLAANEFVRTPFVENSATNSKYLRLCTQGSVSPNPYISCVECSALC